MRHDIWSIIDDALYGGLDIDDAVEYMAQLFDQAINEVIGEDLPRLDGEPDESMRWAVNQEKYEQRKRLKEIVK